MRDVRGARKAGPGPVWTRRLGLRGVSPGMQGGDGAVLAVRAGVGEAAGASQGFSGASCFTRGAGTVGLAGFGAGSALAPRIRFRTTPAVPSS